MNENESRKFKKNIISNKENTYESTYREIQINLEI